MRINQIQNPLKLSQVSYRNEESVLTGHIATIIPVTTVPTPRSLMQGPPGPNANGDPKLSNTAKPKSKSAPPKISNLEVNQAGKTASKLLFNHWPRPAVPHLVSPTWPWPQFGMARPGREETSRDAVQSPFSMASGRTRQEGGRIPPQFDRPFHWKPSVLGRAKDHRPGQRWARPLHSWPHLICWGSHQSFL